MCTPLNSTFVHFWSGNLFLIAPFPDLCTFPCKCLGSKWNQVDTKLKAYMAVILPTLLYACVTGKYTSVMQRDLTNSTYIYNKLFEKALEHQVARQNSRHKGLEVSIKAMATKVDWPCYKNA